MPTPPSKSDRGKPAMTSPWSSSSPASTTSTSSARRPSRWLTRRGCSSSSRTRPASSGAPGSWGPATASSSKSRGGTEAERRRLLLSIASGFEFDPSLGAVDCGPLSEAPLHTTEGANAMAAVRDVEPGDLFLSPQSFGAPPMHTRTDGRCEIRVATRGGLAPHGDDLRTRRHLRPRRRPRVRPERPRSATGTAWSSSIPALPSASRAPASRCSWTTGAMTVPKRP